MTKKKNYEELINITTDLLKHHKKTRNKIELIHLYVLIKNTFSEEVDKGAKFFISTIKNYKKNAMEHKHRRFNLKGQGIWRKKQSSDIIIAKVNDENNYVLYEDYFVIPNDLNLDYFKENNYKVISFGRKTE